MINLILFSACSLKTGIKNFGVDASAGPSINITGAPSGINLVTSIYISVSGLSFSQKLAQSVLKAAGLEFAQGSSSDPVSYIYKIVRSDTCTETVGYSSEKALSVPITQDLTSS